MKLSTITKTSKICKKKINNPSYKTILLLKGWRNKCYWRVQQRFQAQNVRGMYIIPVIR